MRVRLEDVCEKESSKLKQSDVIDQNGMYPVYGASGYLGNINTYQQSNYYIAVVKDGAGIGRTMLLPPESSIIGTMQYLIPKDNVLPEYLYYVVKAKHLEKYFSGATIPHIYFKDYKNEQFDLVSFEEQREIINRLKKIEIIIDNLSKNLLLLDELVKARFVEMFGDPVVNDKKWEIRYFSDLGELKRGKSKHRPRNDPILLGGKYPLIQTGDVTNSNTYIKSYTSTYSEEGLKQSKMWKKGTLCITIAANIAESAILTFDACFPDSVVGFTPNGEVISLFIHYWLSFLQPILEENAPAVAQKNLNVATLEKVGVIVPPLELQNQFASFVQEIDKSRLRELLAIKQIKLLLNDSWLLFY